MSEPRVIAFLPIREPSTRVVGKNTRLFAGIKGGLTTLKLAHLHAAGRITDIVVSTNFAEVADLAEASRVQSDKRVHIVEQRRGDKPGELPNSTNELIAHAIAALQGLGFAAEDVAIFTHVTSPFVGAQRYDQAVQMLGDHEPDHDSVLSAQRLDGFVLDRDFELINHLGEESWPRTQDCEPLWKVDGGIFCARFATWLSNLDRIGTAPRYLETSAVEALDIDTEADWRLAEWLCRRIGADMSHAVES